MLTGLGQLLWPLDACFTLRRAMNCDREFARSDCCVLASLCITGRGDVDAVDEGDTSSEPARAFFEALSCSDPASLSIPASSKQASKAEGPVKLFKVCSAWLSESSIGDLDLSSASMAVGLT
eukprot:scaffold573174_cov20-Prasinocladus_malaysianus.AAC.1